MTEQDKENLIATINGMSAEELEVVVTCIPVRMLAIGIVAQCEDLENFTNGNT